MFNIYNNTDIEIEDLDTIYKYVTFLVKKEKLKKANFSIIFVDEEEIKKINKEYRNIDKVTDVISFALEDDKSMVIKGDRNLGDIYICLDRAKKQALEYNHSNLREICFLITHGLLHLLGYDHMNIEDERVMFQKQKELLEEYEIKR